MKRTIKITLILALLIGLADHSNLAFLADYKPQLAVTKIANEYVLSWNRLPYLAFYEIEVLNSPPLYEHQAVPPTQRIAQYRTWHNSFTMDQAFPYRTYWRVSAHGIFNHPLGAYSDSINLTQAIGSNSPDFSNMKPQPTSLYPANQPANCKPMLTWTVIPGAVYYEIEFLSRQPENPNGTDLSRYHFNSSREVFTNGYNADFTNYSHTSLFWRVRALDYSGKPLGVFSDAQEIFIDHARPLQLKPLPNTKFNMNDMPTPLYPVYSWIPLANALNYEVEITSQPPENPNGIKPSIYRIDVKLATGTGCYDDEPRNQPGTYYWRVRGLDDDGNPIGVYSDAQPFVVNLRQGKYAATFGDSITHGGGALSYSPSDWEYDFQTYLNFPAVNLGKSGDTSASMLARFDQDVLPYHPKYLLILGGTNSLRGGTPATSVISDLGKIRDKCFAAGIRPIFLTLPPINPAAIERAFAEETVPNWREEFDTVNKFIRQQRYVIDLEPYLSDVYRELPDYYAIDGLHPDIEGKKLMAQIINTRWSRVTRPLN